jgi:hypothetical protein
MNLYFARFEPQACRQGLVKGDPKNQCGQKVWTRPRVYTYNERLYCVGNKLPSVTCVVEKLKSVKYWIVVSLTLGALGVFEVCFIC